MASNFESHKIHRIRIIHDGHWTTGKCGNLNCLFDISFLQFQLRISNDYHPDSTWTCGYYLRCCWIYLYLHIRPGNKPANSLAVEETHDLITVTDCQSARLSKIYLRIVELIESCQSKFYLFSLNECTHTGNSHKMTLGEVYFFNCTWINNCNRITAYMYVEHYWVLIIFIRIAVCCIFLRNLLDCILAISCQCCWVICLKSSQKSS